MKFQNRRFLMLWYPAAMVVLFGGIGLSIHSFPGPYDWRYRVVSNLTSQVSNPNGNWYFCISLALTCAMLLPLCEYFYKRLVTTARRTATFSFYAMRVGLIAAIAIGFERLFFRNLSDQIHKAHEYLALIAFAGMFLGVVGNWLALSWQIQKRKEMPKWALSALFLASGAPMIGAALSQAYLYFVPNQLGWVGPHWADLGIPLYLSFAFWEWIASISIFVYLYMTLWLVRDLPVTSSKKVQKARRKAS